MRFFVDDYQEAFIFLWLSSDYENFDIAFDLGIAWGICCDYFGFMDYTS